MKGRFTMKYLRYVALLALLALPLAYSQADGYYQDYPYACAPYGYYGPNWFEGGVFIGAGPWYHGWGHPYYGRGYGRGFEGRGYAGRGYAGHGPVARRGFEARGSVAGNRGGFRGRR
jgi:hypothetical protein